MNKEIIIIFAIAALPDEIAKVVFRNPCDLKDFKVLKAFVLKGDAKGDVEDSIKVLRAAVQHTGDDRLSYYYVNNKYLSDEARRYFADGADMLYDDYFNRLLPSIEFKTKNS